MHTKSAHKPFISRYTIYKQFIWINITNSFNTSRQNNINNDVFTGISLSMDPKYVYNDNNHFHYIINIF